MKDLNLMNTTAKPGLALSATPIRVRNAQREAAGPIVVATIIGPQVIGLRQSGKN
jgi:hypothetical protein